MSDVKWDVIVVGAGIAGLSSAYRIITRSPRTRLLILEANDRVGGRTQSVEVEIPLRSGEMDTLDLGAHWICTTQHEIMDLAHEFGIKYCRQNVEGKKVMRVGNNPIRTYNSTIPSVGSYWNPNTWMGLVQMQFGINKIEKIAKTIDVCNPYLHPMAHVYDSQTAASFFRSISNYEEVYDIFNAAFVAAFGCDLSQISLLFFLTLGKAAGSVMSLFVVENFGAEEFRVIGGTQQFSHALAMKIKENHTPTEENNILFNHMVKSIVQINDDLKKVEVLCENGQRFMTRYVVLAAPPNIIARLDIRPPLPMPQKRLYECMNMGNLAKVFLVYKEPFWLNKGYSGEYVGKGSLSNSLDGGRGPICVIYDATTANGLPALVGFVGGETLNKWSTEDDETFENAMVNQIISCFGEEARHPEKIIYKNWSNESHIRGGPINILGPGNMRFFHYLKKPHINIHFAGTNFASKWTGYLSGAVHSGYTAAAEILEKLDPKSLTMIDKNYLSSNATAYFPPIKQDTGFSNPNLANIFVSSSLLIGIGIGFLITRIRPRL